MRGDQFFRIGKGLSACALSLVMLLLAGHSVTWARPLGDGWTEMAALFYYELQSYSKGPDPGEPLTIGKVLAGGYTAARKTLVLK